MDAGALRVRYITSEGQEQETSLASVDGSHVARGLPVRIPPSYVGQSNYPGLFWSATNAGHVWYESLLELAWLWLADFDPHVRRIAAQPFELTGRDGERDRTRFPDFLVIDEHQEVRVIDVKLERMLDKPDVRASLNWTGHALGARGWPYEVWSGAHPTILRNVRLLAAARRPNIVPDSAVDSVVASCPATGTSLGELERSARATATTATPRIVVFAALWRGQLVCDLRAPINARTLVSAA
ncbi:TnsA-like heteromeric transposase endonuclease subunit [Cellulomonas edaphi]|uniref:TnsA-like heteromeric transposase endonuclease subunit n=1 Tax=Cellulomonas edaphi TaxID=3053468 RepID=A0ABT7S2N1_9CELL|nr:TnsA-like heteromeric transposase endonuclease subunit [Cellulomons edaphi]MDM7829868.1 TnsA-like heteromeric transposase endonuclease subunit [Cellulomons edaphi]